MEKHSSLRVSATGKWTFVIGTEFDLLNNGNSVQAINGNRIVYISSLHIGTIEAPAPLKQIRESAVERLGSGQRVSHVGPLVQGDAKISANGNAWQLQGAMCADGTLATCIIDFQFPEDRAWAIDVWKSLLYEGNAA